MRILILLRYILYSIRPSACLMVGLFVLAAYRPLENEMETAGLLFIVAFCGSACCFLVNDIYDRKKDQLNGKGRPIAAGQLSLRAAYFSSLVFLAIYLSISYVLGQTVFILSLISIPFFLGYSPANDRGGLLANIIVAICASGAIWGVAILRNFDSSLFYLSVLVFLMVIVREILLDWLDIAGDKKIGKPSIPITLGSSGTVWLISIFLVIITGTIACAPFTTGLSELSLVLLGLSLVSTWVPFMLLVRDRSNKMVLFNIRFSHVTFVFLVLGVLLR